MRVKKAVAFFFGSGDVIRRLWYGSFRYLK